MSDDDGVKQKKKKRIMSVLLGLMIALCVFLAVLVSVRLWIKYRYTAIAVSGLSMYPTLNDGDIVYLDAQAKAERGDVVIIDVRAYKERDGLTADYIIKRVICLEGDEVERKQGVYYVKYSGGDWQALNGSQTAGEGKEDFARTIGKNEIFFLGDNYAVSKDSSSPDMGTYYTADILGVVPEWTIKNKGLIRGWESFMSLFGASEKINA